MKTLGKLAVVFISFAVVLGFLWASLNLPTRQFKLRTFRVFSDLGVKDFLADRVEQRGACSVFVTEGKEVAYLCFPHMIVPLDTLIAEPKSGPETGATP